MAKPRIIGGVAKGRALDTPPHGTRPSPARLREALFDILAFEPRGRFLDLYAGSGAVGLEAWSRGAGVVTLVEHDRRTAALIARNAVSLGFARADVVTGPVGATLRHAPAAPYDVVFLDPPYDLGDDDLAADLAALVDHGWLVPGALVVVERSARSPEPVWPSALDGQRERRYGETVLWYVHAASPAP